MSASVRRWSRLALVVVVLAAGVAVLTSSAQGFVCTKTWTSAVSGSWSDGTKWTPAGAPGAADTACISVPGTYTVTVGGGNASVAGVSVGAATGTQTLRVQGDGAGNSNFNLTGASETVLHGAVTLASTNGNYPWWNQTGGTFSNGGSFTVDATNGGPRYLSGSLTNTGTFSVAAGIVLDTSGSVTITNQGTVTLGGTWRIPGGSSFANQAGGVVSAAGSGELFVDNGSLIQGAGASTGNPMRIVNGSLVFNGSGGASVVQQANTNVSGTLAPLQLLRVQGSAAGNAQAIVAASFTNNGAITLASTNGNYPWWNQTGGTLTNNGTFAVEAANGGPRYLYGSVDNTGTITVASGIGLESSAGTPVVNHGSVVTAGTWRLGGGSFDNTSGGSVSGSGTGELLVNNGTLTQGAGTTSGNPVRIVNGSLVLNGSGAASVVQQANTTISGTLAAGQSLTVLGGAPGNAQAIVGANFTNNGAITLASTNGNYPWWNQTGGTLTNNGTFTVASANGGPRYLYGGVVNNGTIALGAIRLEMNGSLTQSASGILRSTVVDGATYGWISVPTANLGGTIAVDGGATLATGTTVPVLTYGSHTGTFSTRAFGTQGYGVQYNPGNVTLVALVPGNATATISPSSTFLPGGQQLDVTVTVTATPPAAGTPTGSVDLFDGATLLETKPLDAAGQAVFHTSALANGAHALHARYGGDDSFSPADTTNANVTISANNVALIGVPAANPPSAQAGNPVTLAVGVNGGSGTPTGTVEFFDAAVSLGSAPLDGAGTASLVVPSFTAGTHNITAHYLGSPVYGQVTSTLLAYTVLVPDAVTTTDFNVDANPVATGDAVQVSATVGTAIGTPVGSVEFRDGATVLATSALDGSGHATQSFTLPQGEHAISVGYLGGPSFATSTSGTLVVNVQAPPAPPGPGETAITITGPLAPVEPGEPAVFTATLLFTDPNPGTPSTPTGSIAFLDDGVALGSVGLDAQLRAAYTAYLEGPPTGGLQALASSHSISAEYPGDPVYAPSSTVPFGFVVGTPPPPPPPPPPVVTPPVVPTPGTDSTGGTVEVGGSSTVAAAPVASAVADAATTDAATPTRRDERGTERAPDAPRESARDSGGGGFLGGPPERSDVVSSVTAPGNVNFSPEQIAANFSIAMLFVLLSWFPAEIINSVLKEHDKRISQKFGRAHAVLQRVDAWIHSVPVPVMFAMFALGGGVIYGFLDPHFGLNQTSFVLVAGIAVGLVLITLAHELVRGWYVQRRFRVSFDLHTFPVGVVFAILLVIFSRMADFQPGYTFGLVCGVIFRGKVEDRDDGKSLAVATLSTLALAVGTWLLWIPVRDAAIQASPSLPIIFLDAMLAFVWIFAVQTVVFSLVPLRFLDGEKILKWSKLGWFVLYVLGMFVFVQTLVHPTTEQYGGSSSASLLSMSIIFLAFTGGAVLFWAWFRFEQWRLRREPAEAPERDEASVS